MMHDQFFTQVLAAKDQRDAGMRDFSEWCWELFAKFLEQGFTREESVELVQTYLVIRNDSCSG